MARSQYGLLVQLLGGLITYLLLAIYCHPVCACLCLCRQVQRTGRNEYKERASIKRVRELQTKIRNEPAMMDKADCVTDDVTYEGEDGLHAKVKGTMVILH